MSYPDDPSGVEWIDPSLPWADEPQATTLPPSHRRPNRNPLKRLGARGWIVVGAVVVLAVGGAGTWYAVKPQPPVKITFNGARVDNAKTVLASADASFRNYAHGQLGVTSAQSRCYFQRVGTATKTDVAPTIFCGPVLFFGGTTAKSYLAWTVSTEAPARPGHVTFQTRSTPDSPAPIAAPARLERTDRRSAPKGSGGLAVPVPPAAAADVLTAVRGDLTGLTSTGDGAAIYSRNISVQLAGYGVIAAYGRGSSARSAARGYKLVGFAIDVTGGVLSTTGEIPPTTHLALEIDRGRPRSVTMPSAMGYGDDYVVSVPTDATAVDLMLTDAGITQRISLLDGKPAATNIAVLRRASPVDSIDRDGSAVATVDASGEVFTAPLSIHVVSAELVYFTPAGPHPSGPGNAFLHVNLCFRSSVFVDPHTCHGFRGTDMQLIPAGGRAITGRNLSGNQDVYPVFEVPANFRSGTVTVTGSEASTDGWSMTVYRPFSFHVSFPS